VTSTKVKKQQRRFNLTQAGFLWGFAVAIAFNEIFIREDIRAEALIFAAGFLGGPGILYFNRVAKRMLAAEDEVTK
jgi:hypothetical protein